MTSKPFAVYKVIREQLLFTTVAQKLNQAPSGNGLYIVSGSPFLVLFWRSKKEQEYKKNSTINSRL